MWERQWKHLARLQGVGMQEKVRSGMMVEEEGKRKCDGMLLEVELECSLAEQPQKKWKNSNNEAVEKKY